MGPDHKQYLKTQKVEKTAGWSALLILPIKAKYVLMSYYTRSSKIRGRHSINLGLPPSRSRLRQWHLLIYFLWQQQRRARRMGTNSVTMQVLKQITPPIHRQDPQGRKLLSNYRNSGRCELTSFPTLSIKGQHNSDTVFNSCDQKPSYSRLLALDSRTS